MHSKHHIPPRRVALVARFANTWAAGQYYIENILLGFLGAEEPIDITVLYDGERPQWSEKVPMDAPIRYRLLEPPLPMWQRLVNVLSRMAVRKNLFENRIRTGDYDLVFPLSRVGEYPFALTANVAYWIPDFQECHYPENFGQEERAKRQKERTKITQSPAVLVLSSRTAEADLRQFFPQYRSPVFVLPFAVFNALPAGIDESTILTRYGLTARQYFICPNQFWKHKNHGILIDAMETLLHTSGDKCPTLIFTGKERGFTGDGAAEQLKGKVVEKGLNHHVRFLGFIDRTELLVLIKYAAALLQPSLFEGWNTSIEDARSLSVPIIASDIAVHREQLPSGATLVHPLRPELWATEMQAALDNNERPHFDYQDVQHAFSRRLCDLVDAVEITSRDSL